MKEFIKMICSRLKKLIATMLSVPFMLLMIAVYVQLDTYFIFALIL